jgi:CRP-like cAMP-binding protein
VTREEVWEAVADALRPPFGRLLDVRDVKRVRRVAGDAWIVTVVLAAQSGDLHVADLTVDDSGAISPVISAEHVIEAVKRADRTSRAPAAMPDELSDFGGGLDGESGADGDDDDGLELLSEMAEEPVDKRVAAALARGDDASLNQARELLPRLLADHDRRGSTLLTMAAVEMKLGEPKLAREYVEASAREFADRFDLDALEKAAVLALQLIGHDAFAGSVVHTLLEQSRTRLKPFFSIFDTRSFSDLPEDLRAKLAPAIHLRTLTPGETLVTEGEPSRQVFVVKSGLVGVWLEKPEGGQWLVRCCFPGWLLGEGSVIGGDDPKCTASLRAERMSEVWTVDAASVRAIMEQDLAFGQRIAETKQVHRIDSFFSMHETMGQLDVQVRDEMLSCIQRLETFKEQTLLLPANEIPKVACLVARGSIALMQEGSETPVGIIEADSFYGVRDTIHRIAPSVAAIARPGTTVAFFEGTRLQKLCERSPEHVVAVLERLG